jgi:hypothetical protein
MTKKTIFILTIIGIMLIFGLTYPFIGGTAPLTHFEKRALFVVMFLGLLTVFLGCLLIRNAIVSNSRIMLTQKKEYAALTKAFADASRSLDITGNHMKGNVASQRETAEALIGLTTALIKLNELHGKR